MRALTVATLAALIVPAACGTQQPDRATGGAATGAGTGAVIGLIGGPIGVGVGARSPPRGRRSALPKTLTPRGDLGQR